MTIRKQISIFFASLFLLLPAAASAATLSLRATPASVGAGDTVRVDILLDSAVPTNAFSGTLSYSGTLEPVAVSDGNSIISLWITHPAVPVSGAPITFAGVTPGGFSGDAGVLFSIVFRAKAAGTARISMGDIEVLRNDGAGGKEPVIAGSLNFSVGPKPLGKYVEPTDVVPPETFTAYLNRDALLFDGQSYLAFMTVDKGSGVDHYIVTESRLPAFLFSFFPPAWRTATSPYVLIDQNLTSTVYVKAVDRAGNERLSIYPPHHLFTVYENVALVVILIIVVLLWQKKEQWGRRLKKNL